MMGLVWFGELCKEGIGRDQGSSSGRRNKVELGRRKGIGLVNAGK